MFPQTGVYRNNFLIYRIGALLKILFSLPLNFIQKGKYVVYKIRQSIEFLKDFLRAVFSSQQNYEESAGIVHKPPVPQLP